MYAAPEEETAGNVAGANILVPPGHRPWCDKKALHHLAVLPTHFLLLPAPSGWFLCPRSLHLAGTCSAFLVQIALLCEPPLPLPCAPLPTYPSHGHLLPVPALTLAWSCLRSGPGLRQAQILSGTWGMLAKRVLEFLPSRPQAGP